MISKLNTCSPSFGVVKRSAIEIAIKYSGGNLAPIKAIKSAIDSQKNNERYDVIGGEFFNDFSFHVMKRGEIISKGKFGSLVDACAEAETLRQIDISNEEKNSDIQQRLTADKNEAKRLAEEMLAEAED